jgi:hypothetical protein
LITITTTMSEVNIEQNINHNKVFWLSYSHPISRNSL